MKKLIIMICLTTTTGMANPKSLNAVAVEQVAIVNQKQDVHLEYRSKELYLSIKHLLQENLITIKEAKELWLKHREQKKV